MLELIGISGSLRQGSFNTALLRAAMGMMPDGVTLTVHTLHDIPLYNGDHEAEYGLPEGAAMLKDAIRAADGVIIATPEYNSSLPGVLKNAIDWTTRPAADIPAVFGGKPFGIIGASPGPLGTALGQAAWLPVLRLLGTQPYFGGRLTVANASAVFDSNGEIVEHNTREYLRKFLHGFSEFVERVGEDQG